MDKVRLAAQWNLDQALLWYATRNMDLVEAAAENEGRASDRLTWWTWQFAQTEAISEADAEDRRARRVHGIGDLEPEASDAPSWSALAREFHDLLARNSNVMVSTVDGEWFGFGRFGQGENGAAILVREDRNASSAARAIGRGRETFNPLLKTDDLFALLEGEERSSSTARITAKGEADCRRWLARAMMASPEIRPKPKAAFISEAQSQFSVSARGFERAWANAIQETGSTWGRAGAPKRNART